MDYLKWNDLIASHFFKPEMAGRAVHLYATEELIADLGQSGGADFQDFIEAIKIGPPWVRRQKICQKALQSMETWRSRGVRYPPYIGYLALFVLAAGIEGDFAINSYYPRLRTLMDEEPSGGQYPSFSRMLELWDDLERWSNEDKFGELGIFNINIAGSRIHVGIPIAQTLLTEEELKALPAIFALADLDPTSPPSEDAIARLLAKHGRKHLLKRTLRLLEETSDSDSLRQALLERIVDELRRWDGTAELSIEDGTQVYGFLRLCCKIDSIAGRATMTMRCSTKHEFPEHKLLLFLNNNSDSFSCDDYGNGWSSPIISELDGKNVDSSKFDWCQGLRLQDSEQRWCLKLPASPIRVFVKGDSQGLPGLLEVRQLPKGSPVYLAAHSQCCNLLEKWGASGCQGFERLSIINGLPEKWYFFKADAALGDDLVKHEYPILSLPTTVRLELEGGIRIDRGNRFFKFAPPKVIIQGGDESVKVYCNETLLDCTQAEGIYELPKDTLSGTKLAIEVRKGSEAIGRRSLFLVEDFSWSDQNYKQQFDCFGGRQSQLDNNSEGVAGALVRGVKCTPFNFNTFLPIQGKQRIFFVGKEPGQVAIWPQEELPADWLPVWAISKGRRRGQAMFCGTNLVESEPTLSTCGDRRKLREWKEILWHDRKKILPPTGDRLKALWTKFQKGAERVKG